MPDGRSHDVIVIGAGHNGLTCAAYLARAGLSVLVLEGSERTGGALGLAQTVGRLRASVIRDLRLETHGLFLIRPDVRAFAPQPDGTALTLWGDPARTAEELRALSARDAEAYVSFDRKVRALASFLARLNAAAPPDLKEPSLGDALAAARLARSLRRLGGRRQAREALRVMPMAVADLVGESFETDALQGAIAARAVRYAAMGPRSAGTALALLNDSAGNGGGAAGETVIARGGPASMAASLESAARSFGAEVRTGTEVAAIRTTVDRVTGVALASGEEIEARAVASSADPKRTLLGLLDPAAIGPTLRWRVGNIRTPGVVALVHLTLGDVPRFAGAGSHEDHRLHGRIVIAPGIDYLERAFDASKYGGMSEQPYLEATIPSLADPSVAREGRHVMNVRVQWAPYHLQGRDWDASRDELGDRVLGTLEEYAPGVTGLVTDREVITPLDLERDHALTEGHPLHGEQGLDQFFAWRPLLGHARYRLAIPGLYLCGSGAHPGGGVTGAPGANAAREIAGDLRRR